MKYLIAGLMIVGLLVVPASAVLVTDDGVTVFYDDFESPPAVSVINNGAYPGDWAPWNGTATLAVTEGSTPLPAAAEGLQKAKIGGSEAWAFAAETYMGTLDGVTHVEWMQYVPGTLDYDFGVQIGGGVGPIAVFSNAGATHNQVQDITHGVYTTLSIVRNQWQKWEFDYTANSSDITVTIDGVSDTYTMTQPRQSYAATLQFKASNNGIDYYIDAVPDDVTYLLGDANIDGLVSADDYASVQANFGNTGTAGGGLLGDANHDGLVSADDYASVQANFGNTSGGMSAIPEPATLGLLAIGLIAVLRRRTK